MRGRNGRTAVGNNAQYRLAQPTVSFSFDGFARSAARNAAPILEDVGIAATFYLSDPLTASSTGADGLASLELAKQLAWRGHQIGLLIDPTSANGGSFGDNLAMLESLPGSNLPPTCSYDSDVLPNVDRLALSDRFFGMRGTRTGINHGLIDPTQLMIHELAGNSSTRGTILTVLAEVERTCGWLIFVTHDVRRHPSALGCSPRYFAEIVDLLRYRDLRICPVADVLSQLEVVASH
ncbi:hypothetical protein PSQ90_04960 [Devosia rhodophyticola]|uniref:Polysaccharide deacetylase n=1 Tax=Devosia rhodophyticola TaxID=3026423 RepID=A0ABY7Z0Z7_9HYPH|nr:hypothetical protein [Devosia rhodophyticola]WDR06804.1 hypothetical protein PSQ90_04960 [Devosia rhodophyticola]